MVEIKKTSQHEFSYFFIDDEIIFFINKDELNRIYDDKDIEKITRNTVNTWQKNRDNKEKIENAAQGKIVEDIFSDFVNTSEGDICYLSYDDFRNDQFEKHAPIDGLLFKKDNKSIEEAISKIKSDVSQDVYGRMKDSTFEWLSNHKVFTVEVKSSRVPDKDYNIVRNKPFNKRNSQKSLIEKLKQRDFFLYPRFTRVDGATINNFDDYINFVINNRLHDFKSEDYCGKILEKELKGRCDIYTRIFVDKESTSSFIAYLLGYVHKESFFEVPHIIKMPRKGKSEKALYYVYPINKSNKIMDIFTDRKLWEE